MCENKVHSTCDDGDEMDLDATDFRHGERDTAADFIGGAGCCFDISGFRRALVSEQFQRSRSVILCSACVDIHSKNVFICS